MEIDIDVDIDEDEFRKGIADSAEEWVREYLETEAQEGHFDCDNCGSRIFDIETWQERTGEIGAAGVCRECNERMEIEVDMSDINAFR